MVFLERDEWIGQTVNGQRGAHGPCTLCIALHAIGSDLNALEGINTLPSRSPGESTNSRNPLFTRNRPRGEDRVCSGITRGEIIWLFLLPVIILSAS